MFATVWAGFHYGIDAILGCFVGAVAIVIGHWMAESVPFKRPKCDNSYTDVFSKSKYGPNGDYSYGYVPLWPLEV